MGRLAYNKRYLKSLALIMAILSLSLSGVFGKFSYSQIFPEEFLQPKKKLLETNGFERHPELERHDPSNIIRHNGTYYVWFTEHPVGSGFLEHPSIEYATSTDGIHWAIQGTALRAGPDGSWDARGVLTPYMVPWQRRYYMFYTGVGKDMVSMEDVSRIPRGLGYVVADIPDGPWRREQNEPVLWPGNNSWDDLCCDDANLVYREGKWWLYYKGRSIGSAPRDSYVGVALADTPTGPFTKHDANPLTSGHAFSIWNHRNGIALLPGAAEKDRRIHWSPDGINFFPGTDCYNQSTGLYCPRNFDPDLLDDDILWGFDVKKKPKPRRIFKFELDLTLPR